MAVYIISYDLRAPGRNYAGLIQQMQNVGACRILESVWLADVNQSAIQIRDALVAHIDTNDGLIIVEITSDADWATYTVLNKCDNWLKSRRP